jgi:serpin B
LTILLIILSTITLKKNIKITKICLLFATCNFLGVLLLLANSCSSSETMSNIATIEPPMSSIPFITSTPPVTPLTPETTAALNVPTSPTSAVPANFLYSNNKRITSPSVNQENMTRLVNGNSIFAFNLYQKLKDTEMNLFYSPYSLSEILSMTYGGARGDTEKQMAETLQFSLSQDQLHKTFNNLDLQLVSRGQNANTQTERGLSLHIADAIWAQENTSFLSSFIDLLALNYGAGLGILDFMNAPETSRNAINGWVSEQTNNKIIDLIPPGAISESTRLVIANAIYFDANWAFPFKKELSHNDGFHLLNGNSVVVPMMQQIQEFRYYEEDAYKAIELPYNGNHLSMLVILPKVDHFKTFEMTLTSQQVIGVYQRMVSKRISLTMPKFEFYSSFNLGEVLSSLGMPLAFSEKADFSGMDSKNDLMIGDVVHKAFVSVDETGTEAAAASGVVMPGALSNESQPIIFEVDHPFIFLIQDKDTGTILFIGKVLNPAF